jgi:Tfp pilus assembly protein PilX
MKKLMQQQQGFIPMIIMLFLMIVGAIALAYWRVSGAAK